MATEIKSKPFKVIPAAGAIDTYEFTDTITYRWSLTPSGDLLIYRTEEHAVFSSAIINDERYKAYAKGAWLSVEVIEDGDE